MSLAEQIDFGTSGLRGRAMGFTGQNIAAYIGAFLEHVVGDAGPKRVYVGADLRASSPQIAADCLAAIRAEGWDVVYAGNVPTPALAAYALMEKCPALMVTGSHIPENYNGIKFYRRDGELMKNDEAPMRAAAAKRLEDPRTLSPLELPVPNPDIARAYVGRFTLAFAPNALAGLRLGVDLHSAVGRDLLVEILTALGAECLPFRRSAHFIAVDTEALSAEDIARAKAMLAEHKLDAIVSTDGDGDRPLLIDARGRQVNGDVLGALTARRLNIPVVVTPLSSTSAIEQSGWFTTVVRTRIGSPYVVAAMSHAATFADAVGGFEANGGFLLESDLDLGPGRLARLPTRDALLPLICVLADAVEKDLPVSGLVDDLPARFMQADRLKQVSPERGRGFLAAMAGSAEARARVDPRLATPLEVDRLDGVRMSFADGSIVHFRQSGNAPELRCYVETGSRRSTGVMLKQIVGGLEAFLAADNMGPQEFEA